MSRFEKAADCEAAAATPQSSKSRVSPLGVAFRSVGVYAIATPTDYQKTFGNFPLAVATRIAGFFGYGKRKCRIDILRECEGLVRSGEMLLVLGRPGSGCSTLLRTIAGETQGLTIDEDSFFNYQGISASDIHSRLRGECSYQAELDAHFPTLTVGETIMLPVEARKPPPSNSELSARSDARSAAANILHSLGLTQVVDTKVGNDTIPGISGGERKRLSIAEVLACSTSLQCWDNSTRGLDSANSLQFIHTLKQETSQTGTTAIVSLYQVPDEIYKLFDKVCLLDEGRLIFFGPVPAGREYFERLGFVCPERSTAAEFLTSVTNPSQRITKAGYSSIPKTSADFSKAWSSSLERSELLREIASFDEAYPIASANFSSFSRSILPYVASFSNQIKLCTFRGLIRLKNDLAPPISGIVGNCILAIVLGTVFFDLPESTNSFFGRSALLFFATLLNAFVSGFEPGMLWEQRPIVEKHYRYALYHPASDAIASMICDLPNKILFSIFFNIPIYFLTNLRRTASAFFTFWLFSFTCLLTMSMVFRTIGSWCTTLAGSMAPAALFMLLLMIYSGFPLPISYMRPWLRWFNYINPVGYTFESLMINEFSGRTFMCASFVPEGPSYDSINVMSKTCNVVGGKPGSTTVSGDDYIRTSYGYLRDHLWRNFACLVSLMLFACALHILGATYATVKKSRGEVLLFRHVHKSEAGNTSNEVPQAAETREHPESLGSGHRSQRRGDSASFCWDRLCYDIHIGKKPKRLLDNIEGWLQPGILMALMGESGAGKTTLLNVLANRASTGVVQGDLYLSNRFASGGFARQIGYAQQQDIHLPTSTVREALQFSALLRQPKEFSRRQRLEYVEEVIEWLDIGAFAEAIVGVAGEGLNVEQRKRLTIGIELAARPELLLFLDEPTSGLDSDTAWAICSLLRKLADQGQTILCTIHQPSATLFQMFDKLLLLKKGRSIYFGDIGPQSRTMIEYFESHGARKCDVHHNPAEWLLDVTSSSSNMIDWSEEWQDSSERRHAREEIEELKRRLHKTEGLETKILEFATSFPTQLQTVVRRLFSHFWRTPSYLYSKLALCIGSALAIGLSFWLSPNTLQGIQNEIFAVFLLMTTFTNLDQQIIPQFTSYRTIYETREGPSRMYSWLVFLLANILVEIPWQTLMSALLFACWYYPIGMYRNGIQTDDVGERSALVFLFIWAFMLFTLSLSYLVVVGMNSGPTAVNIAQLLYSLSLIFCGVLAKPSTLPRFWIFMYRVTPLTYLVGGLLSTTLGAFPVRCSSTEVVSVLLPAGSVNRSVTGACAEYLQPYISSYGGSVVQYNSTACLFCSITDTKFVLDSLEIHYSDRWWQLGVTFGYIFINFVATFVIYWYFRVHIKAKRQRDEGGT